MRIDFESALEELPPTVSFFFRSLREHRVYGCEALKMQMTVRFNGEKVGGLNRRIGEWYVSKIFVRNHGGPAALEQRGFRRIVKNDHHAYWALKDANASDRFSEAIAEMTGVSF